jgi:hypothetical protein
MELENGTNIDVNKVGMLFFSWGSKVEAQLKCKFDIFLHQVKLNAHQIANETEGVSKRHVPYLVGGRIYTR